MNSQYDALPRASVLVVEDDPDLCALLADILVMEGYQVMQTGSGTDAVRLARRHQPTVIVLDLLVRGTNGLDVLRELRSLPETRSIGIIVASASARYMLNHELRRVDAVLQKPFDISDLTRLVEREVAKRVTAHVIQAPAPTAWTPLWASPPPPPVEPPPPTYTTRMAETVQGGA